MSTSHTGIIFTDEHKANLGAAQISDKNHNYSSGEKVANMRHTAKRRELGFAPINAPFEDCEGHHITHISVIYIPKALNQSIYHNLNTGQGMEAINTLALDFLINGF